MNKTAIVKMVLAGLGAVLSIASQVYGEKNPKAEETKTEE
jgi:hypothetical protein